MMMTTGTGWVSQSWPWWAGGAVIGLLVPILYYLFNTGLSVSTGYAALIKAVLPRTPLRWFNSVRFSDRWGWRLFFLGGMVLGAVLANYLAGGPLVSTGMGILTSHLEWPIPLVGLLLFAGGFMMGIGARLAGGCTSGHSIHGLATLQVSSLLVTVIFLLFGALSANLVRIFLLGGVR